MAVVYLSFLCKKKKPVLLQRITSKLMISRMASKM